MSAKLSRFASAECVRFASAPFVRIWLSTLCQSYFRSTNISSRCHKSARICCSDLPLRMISFGAQFAFVRAQRRQLSAMSSLPAYWLYIGSCPKGSLQETSPAQLSQHLIRMSLFSDWFCFSVSSGLQLYLRLQVFWRMVNAKAFCTAFARVSIFVIVAHCPAQVVCWIKCT